jgi:hypothetical protein
MAADDTNPKTEERLARWRTSLAEFESERPQVDAEMDAIHKAGVEDTFSGQVRRAIHASKLSLSEICEASGISLEVMGEFLMGKAALSSDDLDRLLPRLPAEAGITVVKSS